MKARRFWVNPLDFKWSFTVLLRAYVKKDTSESRCAITPVLIVRDTPAARKALKLKQAKK